MADKETKDVLVDSVLDDLHAEKTLTNDQYDRAWNAFRRMTKSELMLMKLVIQRNATRLQPQSDMLTSIKNRME